MMKLFFDVIYYMYSSDKYFTKYNPNKGTNIYCSAEFYASLLVGLLSMGLIYLADYYGLKLSLGLVILFLGMVAFLSLGCVLRANASLDYLGLSDEEKTEKQNSMRKQLKWWMISVLASVMYLGCLLIFAFSSLFPFLLYFREFLMATILLTPFSAFIFDKEYIVKNYRKDLGASSPDNEAK